MRVFVSYSHKDDRYLELLETHLASLKREGGVEVWTDQLLLPGDEINPEIHSAIERANVFLMLVSPDYLASYYCVEVELQKALGQAQDRGLKVVSVIARTCDWHSTSLTRFLALPRDGKPISRWSDNDAAFLDVTQQLRRLKAKIANANPSRLVAGGEKKDDSSSRLASDWSSYLNSTDISFQNPRKRKIELTDIYVSPHLELMNDVEFDRDYVSIEESIEDLEEHPYQLIVSGDQAGKSTLLKICFTSLANTGFVPIALNAKAITKTDTNALIDRALREQYQDICLEDIEPSETRLVALVDNFHLAKLNGSHQEKLIDRLKATCSAVIVFSGKSLAVEQPEFLTEASGFRVLKLLDFGHLKRRELIKKWLEAGVAEVIDEAELTKNVSEFERHVNSIIRKNIVPSRPIYVLSVLQSLETAAGGDYRLTSYGHCYNFLIEQALKSGSIRPDELDAFVNLLTHLAFFQYERELNIISDKEWKDFRKGYSSEYMWPDRSKDALLACGILRRRGEGVVFAHKYIFFYYAGKYISELVERQSSTDEVEKLCKNLHLETNANVLIFVTHHTRSKQVIEEIALYADESFPDRRCARLVREETDFLANSLNEIQELVIESRSVEEERARQAERKDIAERQNGDLGENEETTEELAGDFAHVTSSARTVEIIGQIVRNRYGSLSRRELKELSQAGVDAGLRFLDFFLSLIEESEREITKMIARAIDAYEDELSKSEAERLARSMYSRFCYGGVQSVLTKIASSLGHRKTIVLIEELSAARPDYVSIKLVHIWMLLEFRSDFPRKEIESLYKSLQNNVVADRVLREMVVNHLYLNFVDRGDKQWIANKLHIPMKTQQRIEGRTKEKRLPK